MLRDTYYQIKPFIPDGVRLGLRRFHAIQRRAACSDVWPIIEEAGKVPEQWPGWPQGRQFAFVLTHDVEGQKGLDRTMQLAELELRLGFRSSFYFVPEGDYRVPEDLRTWLTANGFEVGVHDLRHDGKLYKSRAAFRRNAERINQHLRAWGATGFRSGFMLHNLDWIRDLDIAYDASTFDTDPFEPQPDGVSTIFPFLVPSSNGRPGYVELPYTLPQDSTVFLYLREKNTRVWRTKADWVAQKGGMLLMLTHPDYMCFGGNGGAKREFSVTLYEDFLGHMASRYENLFWQPLAKEVAKYFVETQRHRPSVAQSGVPSPHERTPRRKIWIDLDNTPHVPFFGPISRELECRGYEVVFTARDAYQVCELATQFGMRYQKIGRHYGKRRLFKVLGTALRAFQLLPFALRSKPALGLSHGSRSQILLCNLLRIPTALLLDYEHTRPFPFARPTWEIMPRSILPADSLWNPDKVRHYTGLKEDVYVSEFKPDHSILKRLGLSNSDIIVTVRPPATEAHYHNPESESLFVEVMNRICATPKVRAVMLPRNKRQELELRQRWPMWFQHHKVVVPDAVLDGLSLLWSSDLVVSGGGTMNREAAALGVAVYSIFRGKLGAVDRCLHDQGRLVLVRTKADVHEKITLEHRKCNGETNAAHRVALQQILAHLDEIMRGKGS